MLGFSPARRTSILDIKHASFVQAHARLHTAYAGVAGRTDNGVLISFLAAVRVSEIGSCKSRILERGSLLCSRTEFVCCFRSGQVLLRAVKSSQSPCIWRKGRAQSRAGCRKGVVGQRSRDLANFHSQCLKHPGISFARHLLHTWEETSSPAHTQRPLHAASGLGWPAT